MAKPSHPLLDLDLPPPCSTPSSQSHKQKQYVAKPMGDMSQRRQQEVFQKLEPDLSGTFNWNLCVALESGTIKPYDQAS